MAVLEAGSSPRAARRYAFVVGKVDTRSIVVKESVSQNAQAPVERGQRWRIQITTVAVDEKVARLEMKLVDFEVPPGASGPEREEITKTIGAKLTFDVDAHGAVVGLEGLEEPGAGPLRKVLLETMATFIEMLVLPLPAAPIGVGARWQQESTPRPGLTERHRYELKGATADTVTVSAEHTATLTRQPIEGAKTPLFQSANVEGKGSYEIELGHVARASRGSISSTMRVEAAQAPEQVQRNVHSYEVTTEAAK